MASAESDPGPGQPAPAALDPRQGSSRPHPVPLAPDQRAPDSVEALVGLATRIEVMDIGAACIAEVPVYRKLLDRGIAHLHAFEGDERHIAKISETYGDRASVYPLFLFDGSEQTVYLANEESGMTSLLRPRTEALNFFNGFDRFGQILGTSRLATHRLDEVPALRPIDLVKMDIQGAELTVLKNGPEVLERCMAIQLEVSFITLYEDQPAFGEVDIWMRANGFVPHCFFHVKRWSIAPTIRNNDLRIPFNQLLEADVVYVRDPLQAASWSDDQVQKLAVISHECFASIDLTMYLLLELDRRHPPGAGQPGIKDRYLELLNR
jgi:FkbM family methyltransferase